MVEGLSITVGNGRTNPRGQIVPLEPGLSPAAALARALEAIPPNGERWWSFHLWKEARRSGERWYASGGVGVDVDYEDGKGSDPEKWGHVAPPFDVAAALQSAATEGKIPGSVFHLTPRGARVIFTFAALVDDRDLMTRTGRGAGKLVGDALAAAGLPLVTEGHPGYAIDQKVLTDLARLLFTPRSVVEGVKRDARVIVMRDAPYDPKELAPPARVMRLVQPEGVAIEDAVAAYNRDHARTYPRNGGDCPVCGHKGCFGTQPGTEPPRWSCFSNSHAGAGRKGETCFTGDALDLDAHAAGCSAVDLLKKAGYLKPAPGVRPGAESSSGTTAKVTAIRDPNARILKSNSFAAVVFILRTPELREKVLGRGALEFNEMTLAVTMNRRPVEDVDYLRVRELCETELGEDESKGFKFSREDVRDSFLHVAKERRFHPVRDYLHSLVWDLQPRIENIPEDVLNVSTTPLVRSLVRKWMIQAVARVEEPGCKAHGVLIFVGPGGVGKSTFFEVLASPTWFGDTAMDLNDKNDAYMKLHSTWIYEWGELESMQRARSQNTVKAFVTSPFDIFRAPYARDMERHLRMFVLCGTTNDREILTEAPGGGNRRYWIIDTPNPFDLDKLAADRDALWAEAYAAYVAGESWHLSKEEEAELEALQDAFLKRDAWEDRVRAWISQHKIVETTIGEVLAGAIEKKLDQWNDRDEQRIGRILRSIWGRDCRRRKTIDGRRDYVYANPETMPF